MNKKFSKVVSVALVSGVIMSSLIVANANEKLNVGYLNSDIISSKASAQSKPVTTPYINGRKYTIYTKVTVTSTYAKGSISVTPNKEVPSGYIGTHCNLYNAATGRVVATKDWSTNPVPVVGFSSETPTRSLKGRYFTRATAKLYNGNGYTVKGANQSPELVLRMIEGINITDEELKERQYLYDTKNMIAALGVNDLEGYILIDDLYDEGNNPVSPDEFLELERKNRDRGYRMIPLYDSDGNTIIGEYRIDNDI